MVDAKKKHLSLPCWIYEAVLTLEMKRAPPFCV